MGLGASSWPSGPLANVEQADTYAGARAWADWIALDHELRLAALLDASTWVRVSFAPPSPWTPATETAVAEATIEAARLAAKAPLLGGSAAGEAGVARVKAGSVEVEFAETKATDLSASRLALVRAMLRAAGAAPLGGPNVRLSKS